MDIRWQNKVFVVIVIDKKQQENQNYLELHVKIVDQCLYNPVESLVKNDF